MRRATLLVIASFLLLLLPTSMSQPESMNTSDVQQGCNCHGSASDSASVLARVPFADDRWAPEESYILEFEALEYGGPTGDEVQIHVIATQGEFITDTTYVSVNERHVYMAFPSDGVVLEVAWRAPSVNDVESIPITSVKFNVTVMLANQDGAVEGDDWDTNEFQYATNHDFETSADGENEQSASDSDDGNEQSSPDSNTDEGQTSGEDSNSGIWALAEEKFGRPSACYDWVYWNLDSVDQSKDGWGCPHYEGESEEDEFYIADAFRNFFNDGFVVVILLGIAGTTIGYFQIRSFQHYSTVEPAVLAARNSAIHWIYSICCGFLGLYVLIVPIGLLSIEYLGNQSDEIWFLAVSVRVDHPLDYAICYASSFMILFGAVQGALNQYSIAKLHFEARLQLLGGTSVPNMHDSTLEESETETEDEGLESAEVGRPSSSEVETGPATFAAILSAMDAQLKEAIDESSRLREELDETRNRVVSLENEVEEKDQLIDEIRESKQEIERSIEDKSNDEGGKSLSLTDSVLVGDSIMGGMKIDKQINNDPEAIARAVINAYREGKKDSD